MPGHLYRRRLVLSRAYAEGVAAIVSGAVNPHVPDSPAADAWLAGNTLGCGTATGEFDGSAECTGPSMGPNPGSGFTLGFDAGFL